ncbi:MAG TPA: hypothetical protein VLL98_03005 [Rickettsiales bacterium]|nr:hypothetical protein [Rickettsiales bacterium]
MKKIFLTILIFCSFLTKPVFSLTQEELKGAIYIDFYNFITSYSSRNKNVVEGAYEDKRIDVSSTSFITYLNPPEKYITYLEYRGAVQNVSAFQKPFLLDWFKVLSSTYMHQNDSTAESILADTNFELFFSSISYSTRGKAYFLTTQKAVSDDMANNLKVGELIKVYLLNLGQYNNSMPVFLVIGYEKSATISQAIKDKMYFQQYFPVLKNYILNRQYDTAKGNIELLLKKYPDNVELKLNLCLVYNKTNFFDKSISCYKEVLLQYPKNYNAYYGIAISYYNSTQNSMGTTQRMQNVIDNATMAIGLISNLTPDPQGSMSLIYYNSLYLRAMAKLYFGDKTAVDDLTEVYEAQPILVSSDSIGTVKKILGIF